MPIDHTPLCGFGLARWCPSLPARRSTRASRDLRPMLRPPTVEWGGGDSGGGGQKESPPDSVIGCYELRYGQASSASYFLFHVSHSMVPPCFTCGATFSISQAEGRPVPFFSIFHTPSSFFISHAGRPDAPEQRDARRLYKVYALRDAMAVAAV